MNICSSRIVRLPCHECHRWTLSTFASLARAETSMTKRSWSCERVHNSIPFKLPLRANVSSSTSSRRYLSQTVSVALRARISRSKPTSIYAAESPTNSYRGSGLNLYAQDETVQLDSKASVTVQSKAQASETSEALDAIQVLETSPVLDTTPSLNTPEVLDTHDALDTSEALDTAQADAQAGNPSSSYVPWYLQHKSEASTSTQPTASGQEPPEIPEHSPALLEPVVNHVFETLGLSHLKILDLRQMTDPPPALGANLLMIMATARSERHLHASADKLCRWLRTEYKLTPFADGLLGRNEMKIAIRRRTRKAKMMSAVGAKNADDGDIADGMRSEWICVNIGRVVGGVLPEMKKARADQEVVGFGAAVEASTIVVQMMTEEKREEIDMEGLWGAALRRQKRNREAMAKGVGEELVEDDAISDEASPNDDGRSDVTSYDLFQDSPPRATA